MSGSGTRKFSKTNWARVDELTDETIDTSDVPPLGEAFFARATLRPPRRPVAVTVHVDPQVLAWFRAQGADWERHVNAALQRYAMTHSATDK